MEPSIVTKLSEREKLWYERAKKAIEREENGYICSWWLRKDYENEGWATPQINYWLNKLVAKGLLSKKTTKYASIYRLAD